MKKSIIGISVIGSGVGQSVINSLNLNKEQFYTVGLGTNPFAYGAYECDTLDYTKSYYDTDFIDDLINVCKKHEIELIIPGHDDEAFVYAKNIRKINNSGISALCASEELIALCRDKEEMCVKLNSIADIFVKSYDSQTFLKALEDGELSYPIIAKPRSGYASKGIEIINSKVDHDRIKDSHIVQELAVPREEDPNFKYFMGQIKRNINPQVAEISIQLVVSPEKKIMGKMMSYNKLSNGVPIEIVPFNDAYIWSEIDKLIPYFLKIGLVGPLNIQGRLTKNGFKVFELNPRFTGITGLRAIMGFNEVLSCTKEWLNINKGSNQLKINNSKVGIRQVADKALFNTVDTRINDFVRQIDLERKDYREAILISGSTGYLGSNLVKELLKKDEKYKIITLDRDKEKASKVHASKNITPFSYEDIYKGDFNLSSADLLIHCGFARPHCKEEEISESLQTTCNLFFKAAQHQVPNLINISSQSVYGLKTAPMWSEDTKVAPETIYAQAKYATEIFLDNCKSNNKTFKYTSLRLGTLSGGAKGLVEIDLLAKLTKKFLNGEKIEILGGMQEIQRFDIRDAVCAIIKMVEYKDQTDWLNIYNLGNNDIYTLKEIANKVVNIGNNYNKNSSAILKLVPEKTIMNFGLDSSAFYNEMNWKPSYTIDMTIDSLFKYYAYEQK